MNTPQLDPERQKQARVYARISRRLMVVDLALTAVYTLAWLLLGWANSLKAALLRVTTSEWLLVLALPGVFALIYFLIDLPLSYYSGFVLPHRFGQSNETLKGWIIDLFKGLAIEAVLGVILLEIIYAVLRAAPETWWLWTARDPAALYRGAGQPGAGPDRTRCSTNTSPWARSTPSWRTA